MPTRRRSARVFRHRITLAALCAVVALLGAACSELTPFLRPLKPGPPPTNQSPSAQPDAYGDALPTRALARLGTSRFQARNNIGQITFVPGAHRLVTVEGNDIAVWDTRTGLEESRIRGYALRGPMTVARDGSAIAAATDEAIHLFNFDGRPQTPIATKDRPANSPTFSPKAMALAAGGEDGRVRVWRLSNRELAHDLPGHKAPVTAVAYAPDSRRIVSGDAKGNIIFWNAQDGTRLREERISDKPVETLLFSPDSDWLVVSDGSAKLFVVNPDRGKVVNVLRTANTDILSMSFGQIEGSPLLVGGDRALSFWDVAGGKKLGSRAPRGVADLSEDAQAIASADGLSVRLWVRATDKELLQLNRHTRGIRSGGFLGNGVVAATLGADGVFKLWDTTTGGQLETINADAAAANSNGRYIAVAREGRLALIDSATDKSLWDVALTGAVRHIAFSPDNSLIAAALSTRGVRVWKADKGQLLLNADATDASRVAFAPDSKRLIVADKGKIQIISTETKNNLFALDRVHDEFVTDMSGSANGAILASVSGEPYVALWDMNEGSFEGKLTVGRGAVSVALTPDGGTLAVGSADGFVELWRRVEGDWFRQMRFRPHQKAVRAVDFSAGGLMTASSDGGALLWALDQIQPKRFFKPQQASDDKVVRPLPAGVVARLGSANLHHDAPITDVLYTADGRSLITAAEDGAIQMWDSTTGELQAVLEGHEGIPRAMTLSPDGRTLAATDASWKVLFWDLESRSLLSSLEGPGGPINSLAWGTDSLSIAVAGDAQRILVYDLVSGQIKVELEDRRGQITSVSLSPFKYRLTSANADGTVQIWSLKEKTPLVRFKLGGPARSVVFSPIGRVMYGTADTQKAYVWNTVNGEAIRDFPLYAPATKVKVTPDGQRIMAIGPQGVSLWNPKDGSELLSVPLALAEKVGADMSPDGLILATASGDRTVRFWNVKTGTEKLVSIGHHRPITSVARSDKGDALATGSDEGIIILWDTATNEAKHILRGHNKAILNLSFSPDQKILASASADGTVRLWDAATGKALQRLEGHEGPVNAQVFMPDGRSLTTAGEGGAIFVWNVATGFQLAKLDGSGKTITSMALSKDGQTIYFGCDDGVIRAWSAVDYKIIGELRGHLDPIAHLAMAPGGQTMASSDTNGTIHVWRLREKRIINTVETAPGRTLRFAPDGERLLSLTGDNIQIFDALTSQELIQIGGYRGEVTDAMFSADGDKLYAATTNTTVLVWDLAQAALSEPPKPQPVPKAPAEAPKAPEPAAPANPEPPTDAPKAPEPPPSAPE